LPGPASPADEIDAIGKARSSGPTDSGTQEREQGLLQLLTEMDGFYQNDKVGCCLYCFTLL
jgi:cell division protease FtsH